MAGRLPLADIEAVLAFFQSDLGRKVADLEASAALEDTDHIEAVGAPLYLTIKEWNPERARQIDLMIELLSDVEWATRTTMNLWYAFLTALYAGPVGDGGMTDEEILAYLNEMGLGLRSQVDLYLKADYTFTYNELSDAELETYLSFLRSEPGLSFFSEYRESFAKVFEDRARAFASEYRLLVGQKRS